MCTYNFRLFYSQFYNSESAYTFLTYTLHNVQILYSYHDLLG
jgi:hypothetical protein